MAKKAAKGGKSSGNVQVVLASRIKDVARGANVRVAGDFVDAANAACIDLLKKAINRCKGNGRQTIRPSDI